MSPTDLAAPQQDADGARPPAPRGTGATVWLTGLSGAGKTTIALALAEQLRAEGQRVEILDGDEIRTNLSRGLGFSRQDRDTHVHRVGYVARLLARNGVTVLVPVIAPYRSTRAEVRTLHELDGTPYVEVFIATPLEVCAERDVKGLYAGASAGDVAAMTGVSDPYEPPEQPDVRLDTSNTQIADSARALRDALAQKGI